MVVLAKISIAHIREYSSSLQAVTTKVSAGIGINVKRKAGNPAAVGIQKFNSYLYI